MGSSRQNPSVPRMWFCLAVGLLLGVPSTSTKSNTNAFALAHEVDGSVVTIPKNLKAPPLESTRAARFPSREERVKLYMSNWYVPPCPDYLDGFVTYSYIVNNNNNDTRSKRKHNDEWPSVLFHEAADITNSTSLVMESVIEPDKAFVLDEGTLVDCTIGAGGGGDPKYQDRIQFRSNMRMYCVDIAPSMTMALEYMAWERQQRELGAAASKQPQDPGPPTILQFGDSKHSHVYRYLNLPHIKKFRSAATSREALEAVTSKECYHERRDILSNMHDIPNPQAIIWKLASPRHFGMLDRVYQDDTPWALKVDMAVFRGQLTGSKDGYVAGRSDLENCMDLKRCRLVYAHGNSTLVYARLTSTRNRMPAVLHGVTLLATKTTIAELLRYKAIIMLEGNDVASGLKWALLSQSVVLMPPPKITSWAMEELLEPWVHYIPLNENATDVEEKMQWVLDNEDLARRIAERASLWMEDMIFHPDAMEDERYIQEEIIRRYQSHFSRAPGTSTMLKRDLQLS